VALAAGADTGVDGLIALVRAGIRSQLPDKQLAKTVSKLKLDERLEQRVVEELESEGAGPETTAELDRLREAAESKPSPVSPPGFASLAEPTGAQVRTALEAAREYAAHYALGLPDFLCTENIHRYEGRAVRGPWSSKDLLTVQVTYFHQAEDYKLLRIDERPTDAEFWSVGGALTGGEFGTLMVSILSENAGAELHWDHWTHYRGRLAQVYAFRIPSNRSSYQLEFGLDGSHAAATAGQTGFVYLDADSHAVLKITRQATELPAKFPITVASTALDYDAAEIGGQSYLLPVRAEIRLSALGLHTRNQVEFGEYRKFAADATIVFGDQPTPIKH
jgi:hypothetical protein